MSILTIALPFQAALPAVETVAGDAVSVARPLLGLGVLAAVLMMFKPLLAGLLRAGLFILAPRAALQQRAEQSALENVEMLNGMVRELETTDPNMATELRSMAARN